MSIPARVRWTVERLAVDPEDHLLEIGCGSGVAAAVVCERLVDGSLLAIDRSATQIERARRRNRQWLAAGRLALEAVALADLEVGAERFDKAFAINVNVFWTGPATIELARLRSALSAGGGLYLVYEAPGPSRARVIIERVAPALADAGFAYVRTEAPTPTLVCCVAAR